MFRYEEDQEEVLEPLFRYTRLKIALALLAIGFVVLFHRIVVPVDAGQAAVLFRRFFGGVVLNRTYGEGIHVVAPWDHMQVYDVRIQEVPIEYTVLTAGGLSIKTKISVRFHPGYDTLAYLHDTIGPDYVHKVVIPVVQYAVRTVVGAYSVDEVYANKDDMLGHVEQLAATMLAQKYVTLDGILFKDIELPKSIREAIQYKEQQRQLMESYEFRLPTERQEALRKQLEALGWQNYNRIVSSSIDQKVLMWRALATTRDLATSDNAKVIVVGSGPNGLPVMLAPQLGDGRVAPSAAASAAPLAPITELSLDQASIAWDKQLRRVYEAETAVPGAAPTATPTPAAEPSAPAPVVASPSASLSSSPSPSPAPTPAASRFPW